MRNITHISLIANKVNRPDCNKAFSCGSNLRRHFKTHKRVLRHSRKVDEIYAAICPNTCSTTPKAPLVYVPQGSHAAMDYFTGESFLPITPSPQYQGLTASSWCQPAIAQRDAHIISATMLVSLFPELLGTSDGALLHIPLGHFDTILKERSTDTANGLQISIE